MIDVHPPHQGIQGARDFFLHLLTITIGLLIALGLEACVEWVHHRNLRREADSNLRHELTDNQNELAKTRAAITQEHQNLLTILQFLGSRIRNEPMSIKGLSLTYILGDVRDASWNTASNTGALSYMEYAEVQRYADAYSLQTEYVRLQRQVLDDYLQLDSYFVYGFDPQKMTAPDAEAASADAHRALSHLAALNQFAESLSRLYKEALTSK